jgi:hypothetical protein
MHRFLLFVLGVLTMLAGVAWLHGISPLLVGVAPTWANAPLLAVALPAVAMFVLGFALMDRSSR